ncbi:MAG: AraC family transcriptional regulator [Pseudomonadales bacterium]|nr:AraC family transcriptional regulator [Pseudomonadales bacterium]
MSSSPSHVAAKAPYIGTVYYRQRSILLLAPTLVIEPEDKTYRRQSIRLILGLKKPMELAFSDGARFTTQAMLVSADSGLCDMQGNEAQVALMDVTPATPEYAALAPFLGADKRRQLPIQDFENLAPRLIDGQSQPLSCEDVEGIMQNLVFIMTGSRPVPLSMDHRIVLALKLIETLPLTAINLATLSDAVNLSTDRFRHLFKDITGCTVSQYARQTAVWRALEYIENGYNITGAAHAVGFHDVSHLYRVYSEMFGVSLSEKNNPRKFRRVRCFN